MRERHKALTLALDLKRSQQVRQKLKAGRNKMTAVAKSCKNISENSNRMFLKLAKHLSLYLEGTLKGSYLFEFFIGLFVFLFPF